jgi:hypothetical protein
MEKPHVVKQRRVFLQKYIANLTTTTQQVKLCGVRGDIGLFQWHCKKIMAR